MKLLFAKICLPVVLGVVGLGLTGCETTKTGQGRNSFSFDPPVQQPKNPSAVKVKISTGAQRLYVVEGDRVLLASPITVGKASTPTPSGNFTIYSKQANRRRVSSPGAGYPMTYWMEFKSAYGIHWGFMKPVPSTLGCVRMPIKAAQKTFNLIRSGTPLNVASSQPWDNTIGKTLPVLNDSALPDPPMAYMLSPQVFADARQGKMWNF
ncbi:MAG: L,D-transpeptidase [Terrimicrobiaceae bacterium]